MKLDNTKWVQAYPKKLGTFDCSPKYIVPNSGSVIGTTLNAQGYATPVRDLDRHQAPDLSDQSDDRFEDGFTG